MTNYRQIFNLFTLIEWIVTSLSLLHFANASLYSLGVTLVFKNLDPLGIKNLSVQKLMICPEGEISDGMHLFNLTDVKFYMHLFAKGHKVTKKS